MAVHPAGRGAAPTSPGRAPGEHTPGEPGPPPTPEQAKRALRERLVRARRALTPEQRAQSAERLTDHVLELAARLPVGTTCAYLPIGTEPGSPALLDGLRATGRTVLLPVVPAEPGPLDWAPYTGPDSLGPGPLGLREPTTPRVGPAAVAAAALVLVPALAVDRAGRRLGRGGGYYDRTLTGLAAAPTTSEPVNGPLLLALLHDGELIDTVPTDPHDVPVGAVALPTSGIVVTGNKAPD